ncbi:IS256 family transposase [Tautonia marina]|uniref:IS256 family transposase n=1 Tax=Tautonia marina TaxID=2653855 RepID=UPI001260D6D9
MDQSTTQPIAGPTALSDDPLTDILRRGARTLLAQAIEAEVVAYLDGRADLRDEAGRRQVIRNGYLPERTIHTGVGPVEVRQPRVRDRRPPGQREAYTSAILPPYLRRTKSLEDLIPWLYLKGVSTGDFSDALEALLGPDAPGLSATTVTRLKAAWEAEYHTWSKRPLEGKHYVYVWADGVHFNIRLEQDRQCMLVLMGATADGKKELIAVADGYRESEQSWKELLLDCKARGLAIDPALAIGDGALGFWKAVRQVWPATRPQRCWVHKTANTLDKMPKGVQPKAKAALHAIYEAESHAEAEKAFDLFISTYQAKYPKAVECLAKDREALLAFYDFPAEHWRHIRTTNPIESTFATVRLRHGKTKGSGSRVACLTMVFKLMEAASKKWRLLNGSGRLGDVIRGVKFVDGIEVKDAA